MKNTLKQGEQLKLQHLMHHKHIILIIGAFLLVMPFVLAELPSVTLGSGTTSTTIFLNGTNNDSLYWDGHAYSNLVSQWLNDAGYITSYTDTNESTRFGRLTQTDCPAGFVVGGVETNGSVMCILDATGTSSSKVNLTTKTCSGTDKVSAIDNSTGEVTCSADVSGGSTDYTNLAWINQSNTFIGTQNFTNVNISGNLLVKGIEFLYNHTASITSMWGGYTSNWYNHTLAVYTQWNDKWSSTFNSTYESAANNGSYNLTYQTWSYNHTLAAIQIGNNIYLLSSNGIYNSSYEKLFTNSSVNQTLNALLQGNITYLLASNGIYNLSYQNLFLNSSINWTDRTMIIANQTFALIGSGGAYNRTYESSFLNGTYNLTYQNYANNVSLNWTALSITQAQTLFDLLSDNSTKWNSINSKLNANAFNVTNNSYVQINNGSLVLGGSANRTKSDCSNITGSVSNLCTLTASGDEADPIWTANWSNYTSLGASVSILVNRNQTLNALIQGNLTYILANSENKSKLSYLNITGFSFDKTNDSYISITNGTITADKLDGKHYDANWNSTTNDTQYSEALNKYNISYASPFNQNKTILSYLNITGFLAGLFNRNFTTDVFTELSSVGGQNRTILSYLNISGIVAGLFNVNHTANVFTELSSTGGRNRTVLDVLNITGLTAGLYNKNMTIDAQTYGNLTYAKFTDLNNTNNTMDTAADQWRLNSSNYSALWQAARQWQLNSSNYSALGTIAAQWDSNRTGNAAMTSVNISSSTNMSKLNVYGTLNVMNSTRVKFNVTYIGMACLYYNGTTMIGENPCTQ